MAKSRQDQLVKFDNRLTDYNLTQGNLTKEELQQHLASLPDLADQASSVDLKDNEVPDETH